MDKVETMEKARMFCEAQEKAEQEGKDLFACPLCGGEAWWGRLPITNRLWCGCKNCDTRII